MSRVRKLAEKLLESPKYLSINPARVEYIAKSFEDYPITLPTWDDGGFYPESNDFEELCLFYLVFNSINFCYFDSDGNKFDDGQFSGSSLCCKRLTQSWQEIKDPYFLANVDENYLLLELLYADSPISMVKERVIALRELGSFIISNPDFKFSTFFRKYRRNIYFASQAIPTHLPTWRDPFYKRAQLFVSMVYGRFSKQEDLPITTGFEDLTVFSDYKVPQTLMNLGLISPGTELQSVYQSGLFLESGSRIELEIRAASIVASDLLIKDLRRVTGNTAINALHVDFLLWSARKNKLLDKLCVEDHFPHHFTMTTDY